MSKREISENKLALLAVIFFYSAQPIPSLSKSPTGASIAPPVVERLTPARVDIEALRRWSKLVVANEQRAADFEWKKIVAASGKSSDMDAVMQSAVDEYRFASGGIVKPNARFVLSKHLADLTLQQAGAKSLLSASAISSAAEEFEKANDFEMALQMRRQVVDIRNQALGADSQLTLKSKDRLARLLIEMGKVSQAREIVRQNEAVYKRQRDRTGLERIAILNSRLDIAAGKRNEKTSGFEVYIDNEAVQKAMRSKDFDDWLAAYKKGDLKAAEKQWIKLVTPLKHCEQIMELLTRARESADLNAANWVAPDEKFSELLMHLHNATVKALGAEHPALAGSCRQIADYYSFRNKHKESAFWWQKKVDILKRNFGMKDHDTIFSMGFLAREQENCGDYDAAIRTIGEAIAMCKFNKSKFLLLQNEQELKRLQFAKERKAVRGKTKAGK